MHVLQECNQIININVCEGEKSENDLNVNPNLPKWVIEEVRQLYYDYVSRVNQPWTY